MTDRKQSLQELLEKVGAGDETWVHLPRIPELHTDLVWKAWSGSLDAALALHNAVLPGWMFWRTDRGRFCVGIGFAEFGAIGPNPARAWLIAILRALIEKDGK